jgi:hypothetical protein
MAVEGITSTVVILQFWKCVLPIVEKKDPIDDCEFAIEAVRSANDDCKLTIDAVLAYFGCVKPRPCTVSRCPTTTYGRAGRILRMETNTDYAPRHCCSLSQLLAVLRMPDAPNGLPVPPMLPMPDMPRMLLLELRLLGGIPFEPELEGPGRGLEHLIYGAVAVDDCYPGLLASGGVDLAFGERQRAVSFGCHADAPFHALSGA